MGMATMSALMRTAARPIHGSDAAMVHQGRHQRAIGDESSARR